MKCDYETLLSEYSGRNAAGDNVVDIINRKWKINIVFCPMGQEEMRRLLQTIANYVVNVSFLNPRTGELTTIRAYTGTPSPDYYRIIEGKILYNAMPLNFIEM